MWYLQSPEKYFVLLRYSRASPSLHFCWTVWDRCWSKVILLVVHYVFIKWINFIETYLHFHSKFKFSLMLANNVQHSYSVNIGRFNRCSTIFGRKDTFSIIWINVMFYFILKWQLRGPSCWSCQFNSSLKQLSFAHSCLICSKKTSKLQKIWTQKYSKVEK